MPCTSTWANAPTPEETKHAVPGPHGREPARRPAPCAGRRHQDPREGLLARAAARWALASSLARGRSEEHTSELQSHSDLVCRLLLEKKKRTTTSHVLTAARE